MNWVTSSITDTVVRREGGRERKQFKYNLCCALLTISKAWTSHLLPPLYAYKSESVGDRKRERERERKRKRKAICNVAFFAEKFCGVENCLKCSETSSSVCEECQNGYVLSREDRLCSTKTGPTFSTGTSERGDRADDEGESGNESGLSDFVIAGL